MLYTGRVAVDHDAEAVVFDFTNTSRIGPRLFCWPRYTRFKAEEGAIGGLRAMPRPPAFCVAAAVMSSCLNDLP
jgi:hypothetical protein